MFSPPTIAAKGSSPNGIELLDERIDERGIVGENTVLKIALALGLRTHPCTSEIRAT